jgi:hypothetical protein
LSHHDPTLNHLKPTLGKALPHRPHSPLVKSIESSRNLDVIGSVTSML